MCSVLSIFHSPIFVTGSTEQTRGFPHKGKLQTVKEDLCH